MMTTTTGYKRYAMVLTFMATLSAALSSCTKDRIPSFPDGQGTNIYETSLFQSTAMKIKTGSVGDVRPESDPKYVPIVDVQGPDTLRPMFKGLDIGAMPDSEYEVRFEVSRDAITAYRVVTDPSELGTLELSIRKVSGQESLVPIFQYPVTTFGVLVRAKNELGEDTSNLRLEETEWEKATHVQVSILSKNRSEFGFADPDDRNTLFQIDALKSAVVNLTLGENGKIADEKSSEGKDQVRIQGPNALRPLFNGLALRGEPGRTYEVRLALDGKNLWAYKVASQLNDLDETERAIAITGNSQVAPIMVPIFMAPIAASGKIERIRNEKLIETTRLRLAPTNFGGATHVKIIPLATNRVPVAFAAREEESQIFNLSTLESAKITATVEKDGRSAAMVEAPAALQPLFQDLFMKGKAGKQYRIALESDGKHLTAYKVVSDITELDDIEQAIMKPRKSPTDPILVPIFNYDISDAGVLELKPTPDGYQTSEIRLRSTEFADATHVKLNPLSKNRQEVLVKSDLMEQIFSKKEVDRKVFTRSDLRNRLNLGIEVKDENSSSLYYTQLDIQNMNLYLIIHASELTDAQRRKLSGKNPEVRVCPAEVLSQLKTMGRAIDDCVLVLRYRGNVEQGELVREMDLNGRLGSEIIFMSDSKDVKDATHLRIVKGTQLSEYNSAEDYDFDPIRMLRIADLSGEFLFRRTMQDSPNGFDYTFPGESGPLEIVKFVLEDKGIRIVRADALTPSTGFNENDKETLMFIPAAYFRVEKTDVAGNPLSATRYIQTTSDDKSPSVIAYVDWTANKIPNVSSPMNYYSLESCFLPSDVKTISGVDHRLGNPEGVLNFTVSTTYSANPAMDCAGIYQLSYFDSVQASFTFNERISFKRYVKPASGDDKPLLDLPFSAQKRLGMGLFTYNKKAPNKNGNVGTDGTEVALPAVWDIRGGKTVDYILAGLPADPAIRAAVIKATRDVVADWNVAFKKAFAGTTMARDSDVVTLKVAGVDIPEDKVGELGDLDKNFLYYVDKRTESSIIGLGGNHANPRSGQVEAGSVFIYGGNILSYVESLRKMYKARADYHKIMDQVIALPKGDKAAGGTDPNQAAPAVKPGTEKGRTSGKLGEMLAQIDPKLAHQVVQVAQTTGLSERLRAAAEGLKQASGQSLTEEVARKLRKGLRADQLAVFEAINASIADGSIRDPQALELSILQNQIRYMGKSLKADQLAVLKANYARTQAVHELFGRLQKANICVRDAAQTLGSLVNGFDITKMSDIDVLVAVYKPTLAHEMGHNLGLRHNFIGSFDKANWYFEDEKKQAKDEQGNPIVVGTSKRDYSSIMDYLTDDHETYDGLGPQDVAAIRTAYTGLIELAPQSIPVAKAKGKLVGDRFIDANEYRKLLGLSSWLNFSMNDIAKLPIRTYLFCTDEDVLYAPVCNRFDKGTTPGEIVRNIGEDYRTMYALRNFPNDKLHFSSYDTGSYIGRIFGMLIPARQFMEETLYQAITLPESPAKGDIINSYADGAFEAMVLLHEIARNPDAPTSVSGTDRYVGYQTDKGIVAIEQKWPEDMGFDGLDERLSVRGIQYDKVIATILLTQREMGFPRYEQISLRLSFPEFENMIGVTLDKNAPDGALTLNLLKSMLMDNVTPMAHTATGFTFLTTGENKSSVNELLRAYAAMGAILNLDVDGLEVKDNLSTLYRVASGYTVPKDVMAVSPSGTNVNPKGELKLWAFDQNYSAKDMIGFVSIADSVLGVKDSLTDDIQKWFAAPAPTPEGDASAEPKADPKVPNSDQPEAASVIEARINATLAKLPKEAGPQSFEELKPLIVNVIQTAKQMQTSKGQVDPDGIRSVLETIIKSEPIYGVVLPAIPGKELGIEAELARIIPGGLLETERGLTFRNAQTLNQIFYSVHPEYNR